MWVQNPHGGTLRLLVKEVLVRLETKSGVVLSKREAYQLSVGHFLHWVRFSLPRPWGGFTFSREKALHLRRLRPVGAGKPMSQAAQRQWRIRSFLVNENRVGAGYHHLCGGRVSCHCSLLGRGNQSGGLQAESPSPRCGVATLSLFWLPKLELAEGMHKVTFDMVLDVPRTMGAGCDERVTQGLESSWGCIRSVHARVRWRQLS